MLISSDLQSFLKLLDYVTPSQQLGAHSADALVARLRRQLEERMGSLSSGMGRLKQIFIDIDDNGDGKLSQRELYDGLEQMRMGFTHEDVGVIFGKYEDRSGFISYHVSRFQRPHFEGRDITVNLSCLHLFSNCRSFYAC